MKLKVLALAAALGFSTMAAQASELPDGPHIVTSGTASVAAVPDIATLAIEVNVGGQKTPRRQKNRLTIALRNISLSLKRAVLPKRISVRRICVLSLITTIRTGKVF